MTKKGDQIQAQIKRLLERNPDGLRIGRLTDLLAVSRNSVYRYLHILEEDAIVEQIPGSKLWRLTKPIKPQTILGYQYQALLQGLRKIGGDKWDIATEKGQDDFKELGRIISPKMKGSAQVDLETLRAKNHKMKEIIEFGMALVDEASSVEQYQLEFKLDKEGFPKKDSNLAAIVTLRGGYVQSDAVRGNGFAHYYILAGIIEASLERIIPPIYGGRVVVQVHHKDEQAQLVDLSLYVIFDEKTPYIDPTTGRKVADPQEYLQTHKHF